MAEQGAGGPGVCANGGKSPIAIIDASLPLKNAFCAKTGADQGALIEAKPSAALQEQRELLVA
jgi:hypothetical protein